MIRILLISLLSLTTINAIAASMAIYKDKRGQVLLTNVGNNNNFNTYTKKVKVTSSSGNNETKKHKERLMADGAEDIRLIKEEIRLVKYKIEKHNLKMYTEWRKNGTLTPDKSQIILHVGNNGIVDTGAKIGMSHDQVLKNTYWGKADTTHTITDEYGKLDYWSYERYGSLVFDNDKLIRIQANSITD